MAKKKSKRTPGKKVIRKSSVRKPSKKSGASAGGGGSGSNAEVQRAVELFKWCHTMSGQLAAGFGEHQMLSQPSPSDNHLLWQIGGVDLVIRQCGQGVQVGTLLGRQRLIRGALHRLSSRAVSLCGR